MKVKNDYAQSEPMVRICKDPDDMHVEVWWNVKNSDGDVYPVELQMSIDGTKKMVCELYKAVKMLEGS